MNKYYNEIMRRYFQFDYEKGASLYEQPNFIDIYDRYNDGCAYYYAALCYISLGKFEEAVNVVEDCLSIYGTTDIRYYNKLMRILVLKDFYTKDYLSLFLYSLPLVKQDRRFLELIKDKIVPAVCMSGDPKKLDKTISRQFKISKSDTLCHVRESHLHQFNVDLSDLYNAIKSNLRKAKPYYTDYCEKRVFACPNVGITYRKEEDGSFHSYPCNYIVVISDCIRGVNIRTFFPVTSIAEMRAYDLSRALNRRSPSYRLVYPNSKTRINKFNLRQSKKSE